MDPDATLKALRETTKLILADPQAGQDAKDLAEAVEALDTWLSKGGFLPEPWNFYGKRGRQNYWN